MAPALLSPIILHTKKPEIHYFHSNSSESSIMWSPEPSDIKYLHVLLPLLHKPWLEDLSLPFLVWSRHDSGQVRSPPPGAPHNIVLLGCSDEDEIISLEVVLIGHQSLLLTLLPVLPVKSHYMKLGINMMTHGVSNSELPSRIGNARNILSLLTAYRKTCRTYIKQRFSFTNTSSSSTSTTTSTSGQYYPSSRIIHHIRPEGC